MSHCSFNLPFSLIINRVEYHFVPAGHLYVFFGTEISIQVFCPSFDWIIWEFFDIELYWLFVYFGYCFLAFWLRSSVYFGC